MKHWYFDCSEVYTLHPNGELVKGCPNHKTESVPMECYSCERAEFCRPCALHNYCTFPKKLAEAIKRKNLGSPVGINECLPFIGSIVVFLSETICNEILKSNCSDGAFNCIFTIRGVDRYASSVFLDNVNNLITKILFLP